MQREGSTDGACPAQEGNLIFIELNKSYSKLIYSFLVSPSLLFFSLIIS
jgi:hypothetical protein